jgi:hypothetical protein
MSSKTSREVLLLTPKDDLMPISGTRCAEENLLPPKSPGFVPRQTSHKSTRSHFGYSNKREWKDVLESSTLVEGTFCLLSSILGNVALAGRRGVWGGWALSQSICRTGHGRAEQEHGASRWPNQS